jgi:hypothetical protein
MSHEEAITECRKAYRVEGARWPVPLIVFLDEPLSERQVFDWLTSCVGDLLDHLGQNNTKPEGALSLARSSAVEGKSLELIEQKAWELWSSRAEWGVPQTAVAQLLFALLAHREQRQGYRGSCATPVMLLDQLASSQGGLLERVVSNFTKYVSGQSIA